MGKANWIIIALGLGSCLALSMLMRHALTVREKARVDPVVRDLADVYGGRLHGPVRFAVHRRGGKAVGVLAFTPRLPASSRHLAFLLGDFVWREYGDAGRFRALEVVACGRRAGEELRFRIPRPLHGQSPTSQEDPAPRRSPTGQPPARPAGK